MKPIILGTIFLANLALGQELRLNQIHGNRDFQLVDAYTDNTVAGFLHASFSERGTTNRLDIHFPAHSFTPHEITLMRIIEGSVDWRWPAPDPMKPAPHKATIEVVFSVPTNHYDFSRWYLVSLKPRDLK